MRCLFSDHLPVNVQGLFKRQREFRLVRAEQRRQATGNANIFPTCITGGFCKLDPALLQRLEQVRNAFACQSFGCGRIGVDGDDPGTGINEILVQITH